ncbi:hypothetical protein ZOSMA_1G02100, partial [Zostera marina]
MATTDEAKLDNFTRWLQVNGADLRGCSIKHCGSSRGYGVYSSETTTPGSNGILMVVPLDLAITPVTVLQDSPLGNRCRELFKEGDVDDRFLIMLFLTVERLRMNSPWKPYIDMLPNSFGTPLWFSEEEFSELKGTPLYRATIRQKKDLKEIFDNKVKNLVLEILNDYGASEGNIQVNFEDFLWANSIFWTRALNIPFLRSYVYPLPLIEGDACSLDHSTSFGDTIPQVLSEISESISHESTDKCTIVRSTYVKEETNVSTTPSEDIVWAEGLVPSIDFCNHGSGAKTTWEVDNIGSITGVSTSMYLLSGEQNNSEAEKEILINYGDRGNE